METAYGYDRTELINDIMLLLDEDNPASPDEMRSFLENLRHELENDNINYNCDYDY